MSIIASISQVLISAAPQAVQLGKSVANKAESENIELRRLVRYLIQAPIKLVATFIFAPFMMLIIVWTAARQNRSKVDIIRALIALCGIIVGTLLSYGIGITMGRWMFAYFVWTHVGWFTAFAFLFGTYTSVLITVVVQVAAFWLVAFVFLKITAVDVVDTLSRHIEGERHS